MKKYLQLALAFLVAGCGQQGEIENAIKARLKDPSSAQFKHVLVNRKGNAACAVWNAKNSFGGYGEWDASELKKRGDGWAVSVDKSDVSFCTVERYKAMARAEESFEEFQKVLK